MVDPLEELVMGTVCVVAVIFSVRMLLAERKREAQIEADAIEAAKAPEHLER